MIYLFAGYEIPVAVGVVKQDTVHFFYYAHVRYPRNIRSLNLLNVSQRLDVEIVHSLRYRLR